MGQEAMINRKDMRVYLDNIVTVKTTTDGVETKTTTHHLYSILDFVTQYRFQGGPEQPLRYLEMKVDKNNIDTAYPNLMTSVVEGKTRVCIKAVDNGTFVITKLWLTDNEYDIVATGIEITLNTATLTKNTIDKITSTHPSKVAQIIINDWKSSLNLATSDNTVIHDYTHTGESYNEDVDCYFSSTVHPDTSTVKAISFRENMPTLVAINMCALTMGAFVFFADRTKDKYDVCNTMYFVHYGDDNPLASNPADTSMNGVVNIYPRLDSMYQSYSAFDVTMFTRMAGMSSKSSEGSETIVNNQIVVMNAGRGEATNDESVSMYGDCAGTQVISDLMVAHSFTKYDEDGNIVYAISGPRQYAVQTNTAEVIAENLVDRYKDPTRSITITLSEANTTNEGTSWEGIISPYSYANKINDDVNGIELTTAHLCDEKTSPFLLRLSTFVRAYPEFTTDYTFGVMKETTLSQELANKLTAMTGNVTDIEYSDGTSIVSDLGTVTLNRQFYGAITVRPLVAYDPIYNYSQYAENGGYPYIYKYAVDGVTSNHYVRVQFDVTEITNNAWSPFCATEDGCIVLFRKTELTTNIQASFGYEVYINPIKE